MENENDILNPEAAVPAGEMREGVFPPPPKFAKPEPKQVAPAPEPVAEKPVDPKPAPAKPAPVAEPVPAKPAPVAEKPEEVKPDPLPKAVVPAESAPAKNSVPDEETAWTVLCELIGEDKAAKFCRAFVRGRKVRITQRKFFMFADVIGAVAAKKVVDTFDGELTTLPEIPLTDKNKEIRDSAIRELRGKIPITTLSAVAGLSRRQIIRIQKGEKNERERI